MACGRFRAEVAYEQFPTPPCTIKANGRQKMVSGIFCDTISNSCISDFERDEKMATAMKVIVLRA
jgi:hypothetical protein